MAPSNLSGDLDSLRKSLASIRASLASFQLALQSPIQPHAPISQSPDPLSIFSDGAKLLRAQTTKVSLLILSEPFSPKEVTFILNALQKSIFPALMSALELCPAEKYTRVLHEHAKSLLRVLWKQVLSLLSCIPEDEKALKELNGKATLAVTGLLWESCDALIELGQKGAVWLVKKKVDEYKELLEDAIAELEDWDPDQDSEESDMETEEEGKCGERRAVIITPTTSDEERLGDGLAKMSLSPQVALKIRVMKHLRLIKILYLALRKRRIATLSDASFAVNENGNTVRIRRLDELMEHMRHFTERADELAGCLYAGTQAAVDHRLEELSLEAVKCVELAYFDWSGKEDEFTKWNVSWRQRLEELKG